jgi:hypothetical protein
MKVRFSDGVIEIMTSEQSTAIKFLEAAGLRLKDDSWVGKGKEGKIVLEDGFFRASFWYSDDLIRKWV